MEKLWHSHGMEVKEIGIKDSLVQGGDEHEKEESM